MAKIFGVDIETPQEQQRRMLEEQLAASEQFANNPTAQFGFNLVNALAASFGGVKKRRVAAEERMSALEAGRELGDAQFIAQTEAEDNARKVYEAHLANGTPPEQAVQAANAVLETTQGRINQITEQYTAQEIQDTRNKAILAGGDPVDAEILAIASASARLRELGGAENLKIANQLNSRMTELVVQKRQSDAELNKLQAQGDKERALAAKAGMSDVEQLQVDREQRVGELNELRARGASDQQIARKLQEIKELDGALRKATGSDPSAALMKSYGEMRKTNTKLSGDVKSTYEIIGGVVNNPELETPDLAKLAIVSDAFTTLNGAVLDWFSKAAAVAGGVLPGDAVENWINENEATLRAEFMETLTANGLSERQALKLFQMGKQAQLRVAKSTGGQVTEPDMLMAGQILGLGSGRLDMLLGVQIEEQRANIEALKDQAELSGSSTVSDKIQREMDVLEEMERQQKELEQWYDASAEFRARPNAKVPTTPTKPIQVDENGDPI